MGSFAISCFCKFWLIVLVVVVVVVICCCCCCFIGIGDLFCFMVVATLSLLTHSLQRCFWTKFPHKLFGKVRSQVPSSQRQSWLLSREPDYKETIYVLHYV